MIHLENIGESNWRLPLHVAKGQERYVSDSMRLLARAYAYRNANSRAFLVCADDIPVGMGLYYDDEPLGAYDFSQLFIDERYQGKDLAFGRPESATGTRLSWRSSGNARLYFPSAGGIMKKTAEKRKGLEGNLPWNTKIS